MQASQATASRLTTVIWYVGLMILFLVIIGVGYGGFRQFAITVMPQMGTYNLLALALIAGIASFFSPCAFPLLPGYLSFYALAGRDHRQSPQPYRTLSLGLAAAAGVVTFNLILGTGIGLLGAGAGQALSISDASPSPFVLWFRGVVGVILLILGLAQWRGINLKPHWADKFAWQTRPKREAQRAGVTLYLYGLGYNAAGMGCTGPILAALMIFAVATGGFGAALSAFLVFSATMGSLMLLISILVAQSQETLIQKLKASTDKIKRVSSLLLFLVGVFSLFTVLNRPVFMAWLFPQTDAQAREMAAAGASMDFAPPVSGFYAGDEVLFIHTEASDREVAKLLTEMMGPQVIFTPHLAEIPETLLSDVYVFTDGIKGSGPFGFQPDVFDSVPGDDDYSPLRVVNLVSWGADANLRLLDSLAEIEAAEKAGEVSLTYPGIVVNMPILTWPRGQR